MRLAERPHFARSSFRAEVVVAVHALVETSACSVAAATLSGVRDEPMRRRRQRTGLSLPRIGYPTRKRARRSRSRSLMQRSFAAHRNCGWMTSCARRRPASACSAAAAVAPRIRPRRASRSAISVQAAQGERSCCSTAFRSTIHSRATSCGVRCRRLARIGARQSGWRSRLVRQRRARRNDLSRLPRDGHDFRGGRKCSVGNLRDV